MTAARIGKQRGEPEIFSVTIIVFERITHRTGRDLQAVPEREATNG